LPLSKIPTALPLFTCILDDLMEKVESKTSFPTDITKIVLALSFLEDTWKYREREYFNERHWAIK